MNAKYEYLANYGDIGAKTYKYERHTLQLVKESWNGWECIALRAFALDGTPGKGVTLNVEQAKALKDALNAMDLSQIRLNEGKK